MPPNRYRGPPMTLGKMRATDPRLIEVAGRDSLGYRQLSLESLLRALPDVHHLRARNGPASIAMYKFVCGDGINWPFLH